MIRRFLPLLAAFFLLAPSVHGQNLNITIEMQYRLAPQFAAQLDSLLPPLPDSVPTAHGWYRVTYPLFARCHINVPKGMLLAGCTHENTIEVAAFEPSLAQKWHTLKHEMAHVMFYDTHISFRSAALEERACDVVATWSLMEQLQTHLAAQP